jgi:hypothetical protein
MSTDAWWALIRGLFWLGFLLVVLAAILASRSRRNLQALKEPLAVSLAQLEAAVNRRIAGINQMYRLLTEQTNWTGSGPATTSQGASPASVLAAHRESSDLLTSMEEVVALRFPDLNVHSEFIEVGKEIEQSESEIQQKLQWYNSSVRIYNTARSSFPTVFYADLMRYPLAERFDLAPIGAVTEKFEEEDDEILRNLASAAKVHIAGGRATLATRYFYMFPGGVPKGPASINDLKILLAQGVLQSGVMVAEVGSQEWKSIEKISAEWEEAAN